jgi:predicted SAM-dependent methyltransferase
MTSFIKSVLLSKYVTRKGISIMDIGCGRGHDIKKWRLYEPKSIALVDVSESNLGAAENMLARTPFGPDCNPEKLIINTDFCVPLPTEWNLSNKFNVVQMHSVLQYMLFSDDAAKQMLKNVFNVLTADGVFICTVPDGSKIHSHLVNKGQLVTASDNTQYVKYDNKHYSVQARREYLRENPAMLLGTSSAATGQPETLRQEPIRGMPYLFMLRTQVGDLQPRVFSAHEYIVLLHDFINMAYEAGFQVSLRETFASFLSFELSNNKNSNLMRRMNLTSDDMNIDKLRSENREDDVSFLDLHSVLVFVKRVDML